MVKAGPVPLLGPGFRPVRASAPVGVVLWWACCVSASCGEAETQPLD